jgi:hypothetical protein
VLGHHALVERKLRQRGKSALATVLEGRQTNWSETTGNPGLVGNTTVLYDPSDHGKIAVDHSEAAPSSRPRLLGE